MRDYQEKILNYILFFLLSLTGLSSLLLVKNNYLYVFVFIFLILYWQRIKVGQVLAGYLKSPPSSLTFLILGMVGVLLFQVFSRSPRFYQRPILTLIVSLIFYLPYFALWLVLINRYHFTLFEIFYLSGLGRLIFDLLITHKLLIAASVATSVISTFLIFFIQGVVTLVLFGILTTFPAFYIIQEEKLHDKPLSQYLVGLTPGFLAAGVFIVWSIILKIIFT